MCCLLIAEAKEGDFLLSFIKKKFYIQVILVFIFGVVLELCWFNLDYLMFRLKDVPKNVEYTMEDAELYNWQKTNEGYISQPDPMIVLANLNYYVENICINTTPEVDISDGAIFYTNNNIAQFGTDGMIQIVEPLKDANVFVIGDNVKDLRVDIGESEGTVVNNVKLTINVNQLDFRFTRVIIIVLIYVVGYFLLTLQRPRKYDI